MKLSHTGPEKATTRTPFASLNPGYLRALVALALSYPPPSCVAGSSVAFS